MAKPDLQVSVTIKSLKGVRPKCPRCKKHPRATSWNNFGHTRLEIEANPELAKEKLCDRCSKQILDNWPGHPAFPYVQLYINKQKEPGFKFAQTLDEVILWD